MNIYFITVAILTIKSTEGRVLDDYIQHYEELRYDPHSLHQSHLRAKRSTTNPSLSLKFKAFGRNFHLQLERSESIFTVNHKLRHSNGSEEEVDTSFIYEGKVRDIKGSFVHGAVIEGVFRGYVRIPGDTTYHIEHSRRFFGNGHPVHSVIYSEKHLNLDPYKHKRKEGVGTCGADHLPEYSTPEKQKSPSQQAREQYANIYSRDQQDIHNDNEPSKAHVRHKRATGLGQNNTCYLFMQSDPILLNYLKKGTTEQVAKDEILAMFAAHVSAINDIYTATDFVMKGGSQKSFKGLQFRVQRTKIMTDKSENCDSQILASKFCNPNIDVSNFLELNSLTNHNEFCLAYVFSARDFIGGTLGLAMVGSFKGAVGGACEKWRGITQNQKTVFQSLNTGIVTIVNFKKQVAPRVSHLTFAHECGHNFGSPHDTGPDCAPYGTSQQGSSDGNYIMYASATTGDLKNNIMFSTCSRDNISRVLDAIITGFNNKENCFKPSDREFCGNGLVEGSEECDCGYEEDCDDACCNPKKLGETTANQCKLKATSSVKCSPGQGPCCTKDCKFVTESSNMTCRVGSDCVKQATCNGTSAHCPAADIFPDIMTYCNQNKSVCEKGLCTGSLCKKVGYAADNKVKYKECFSAGGSSCYLSCQKINDSMCMSSADTDKINDTTFKTFVQESESGSAGSIKLSAGSPCNDYKGYCDAYHRCRSIDNDSPFNRLKNLLFNEETFTFIIKSMEEYWWAVMLCAIGLVLLMGLFIKVCAVHTPSSNPKAVPARKLTDSLRRGRQPQRENIQTQPMREKSSPQYYPSDNQNPPPPPYSRPPQGGGRRPPQNQHWTSEVRRY